MFRRHITSLDIAYVKNSSNSAHHDNHSSSLILPGGYPHKLIIYAFMSDK